MSQIEENKSNLPTEESLDENVGYLVYNETLIDHFMHPRNVLFFPLSPKWEKERVRGDKKNL